ncbi:nitroreductase family protein [Pulveribacter suum]|uniref:Putative NAD(P)H nitroreductase n=1 Tax=Pulveribacter suum TaxID=2116657 RepID=A0A2P1NPD0_9BURK|nr:nitroreductase family protein [Pulveribacter suum]AVP58919.1 nitroreductase [Pulveribacter suum]
MPRRLAAPGPGGAQLQAILEAARHAPDHGCLLPWRFILVPQDARAALGQAFVQALLQRDPQAGPDEQARARDKAGRAPVLLLAVVDEGAADAPIAAPERWLSAGCALHGMLLMATALGYGSALTSGRALAAPALRALFALAPYERAACFLSIGTVLSRKPARQRPAPARYVTTLMAPGGGVHPWPEHDRAIPDKPSDSHSEVTTP